ncbi:Sugar diacid utilization regulator [Dethiosulfatibacter aminovorans DSM 17477]|uniref:Sugar diacid utilization regulator n=1 Tax=Dethiosulfatibacter aminovorans DSM 17477 TaxID=1121476 RepID=A0A1M6A9Q7_9FIRM|nr:PucR family transcriptional regulator [Dethiosulfatibacter aminovorans]SHI33191.1 Sugar diacid utilization regulator [Dethiosulfatibacter aminovorans DSM 17477]
MSITVKDILQLDVLKNAELIAGKNGLNREVLRVNFTDCPLEPEDPGYKLVEKGDLYIHSFYIDRIADDLIYNIIQFYIQTESSCCIGLRYYINQIPDKTLDLANKNKYPIIMIDADVPYGQVIKDISELILTDQIALNSENKINRLLYDRLDSQECNEIMQYLSPDLPLKYLCVYIKYSELTSLRFKLLKSDLFSQFQLNFLRYRKGGFLILDQITHHDFSHTINSLMNLFAHYGKTFSIGVSSSCEGSSDFARSFKEAHSTHEVAEITGKKITYYNDLSIYNLLQPLRNHEALKVFCKKTLEPLKEYEKRHSSNLIETIRIYLENNGDYKKTAYILHTHENTIRFRIKKAMTILGMEDNSYTFIEHLSLALKAELLL